MGTTKKSGGGAVAAEPADAAIARIEARGGLRWEWYTGGRRAIPARVSFTKGGLSMTATAWEAIGGPGYVELGFERTQRLVGIRPANGKSDFALTVRKVSQAGKSRAVSATAFVQKYDIQRGRYPVRVVDGMLLVPLRERVVQPRRGKDNGS